MIFADGIRPGGDLTEDSAASAASAAAPPAQRSSLKKSTQQQQQQQNFTLLGSSGMVAVLSRLVKFGYIYLVTLGPEWKSDCCTSVPLE